MEDLKDTLSWSRFYSYRKEIRRMYPSVYNLKIRKKLSDVIIDEIKDGALILVFRRLFRMYVASHLHRYLDVDFAKSIIAVAVKK
jgi:hypothetical protein